MNWLIQFGVGVSPFAWSIQSGSANPSSNPKRDAFAVVNVNNGSFLPKNYNEIDYTRK